VHPGVEREAGCVHVVRERTLGSPSSAGEYQTTAEWAVVDSNHRPWD